jgi:hypothetical protein
MSAGLGLIPIRTKREGSLTEDEEDVFAGIDTPQAVKAKKVCMVCMDAERGGSVTARCQLLVPGSLSACPLITDLLQLSFLLVLSAPRWLLCSVPVAALHARCPVH